MEKIKISCIIPTCGRKKLLLEAVNSVLAQTFQACEIIIVNNGPGTLSLPKDILDRIIVYNIIPYAGASQARNFGASLAKAGYLAFLDEDDLWGKDYLKNVSEAIKQGEQCVVSRLDKLAGGKVKPYKDAKNDLTIKNLLTYNPGVTGSNIVISKKLFFEIGGFDAKLSISEDKSLLIELLRRNIKVKVLSDNQAIYRKHRHHFFTGKPKKLARGLYYFTKKYSHLMGPREYLYNWLKIYKNRYQAGQKMAILPLIFLKIPFSFIRFFKKCLNTA